MSFSSNLLAVSSDLTVTAMLHQGKTRIAEVTDGSSNTIAVGEDAGRDPRCLGTYTENQYDGVTPLATYLPSVNPNDPGPAGGYLLFRRSWRWAEPVSGYGISGVPNNKYRPDHEAAAWTQSPPAGGYLCQGCQAGNNDELFSFHPGGINVLMGDGSVRFLKDSVWCPRNTQARQGWLGPAHTHVICKRKSKIFTLSLSEGSRCRIA